MLLEAIACILHIDRKLSTAHSSAPNEGCQWLFKRISWRMLTYAGVCRRMLIRDASGSLSGYCMWQYAHLQRQRDLAGDELALDSIRQHTSAYVIIRHHTSAYVSIRHEPGRRWACPCTSRSPVVRLDQIRSQEIRLDYRSRLSLDYIWLASSRVGRLDEVVAEMRLPLYVQVACC